jgi:hypothetical protein
MSLAGGDEVIGLERGTLNQRLLVVQYMFFHEAISESFCDWRSEILLAGDSPAHLVREKVLRTLLGDPNLRISVPKET